MGINSAYKLSGQANDRRDLYLSHLSVHPEDKAIIKAWNKLKGNRPDKEILHSNFSRPDNYLVSAIVSTYQSEAYIGECLDNLEGQSIANLIEIVIVDAASPEKESQIVKDQYGQFTNISYLRTKGKISVYAAWNLAIKASTGKYCISVSTNDQLRPNACELLADYLDKNDDCMLVYGDTYLTREPHETFDNNRHFAKFEWPDYHLISYFIIALSDPTPCGERPCIRLSVISMNATWQWGIKNSGLGWENAITCTT